MMLYTAARVQCIRRCFRELGSMGQGNRRFFASLRLLRMTSWCGWSSTRLQQSVPPLPGFFEPGADAGAFFFGSFRGFDEMGGFGFGLFQQGAVAEEVGDSEVGEAGLAGSEEFSGAAHLEVEFG